MREITYIITPADDGRRLSRVVRGAMGVSQHLYASLKAQNAVCLDGRPARADTPVRAGQRVSFVLEEEAAPVPQQPPETAIDIVYEDKDIIIVNKPAPLSCMQGLTGDLDTLESRMLWRYRDEGFIFRPVNRLDKGTSGLMAVARHAHAQQRLQRLLHTASYTREYIALVEGRMPDESGTVDAPIGKADGATVRREVREGGKPAVTHYQALARGEGATLLKVRLETGRTHQIRVHMAHLGHPIVGDFLYGHEDARLPHRFALHSCELSLLHPATGERMRFSCPPPPAFDDILNG